LMRQLVVEAMVTNPGGKGRRLAQIKLPRVVNQGGKISRVVGRNPRGKQEDQTKTSEMGEFHGDSSVSERVFIVLAIDYNASQVAP